MLLSPGNIRKTINYIKKNGVKEGYYATMERISQKRKFSYEYEEPQVQTLEEQAATTFPYMPKISILVPAYETKPIFMEDLILSVEEQSYSNFELIIADASESDTLERLIFELNKQFHNIEYHRLGSNDGISENSNKALSFVTGDYVALLDHDDTLTPDALFEIVKMINKVKIDDPVLIFSDEDKGNEYMDSYYEPNIKNGFNKEMFMTNNYICHLSVIKTSVLKELGFRKEYDGAQDYDLLLRILLYVESNYGKDKAKDKIVYVPKVLYHWRCHESSTAANPQSKMYAYDAGKRAVENYLKESGYDVSVSHSKHLGFYKVNWKNGHFASREDVGVIGGPVIERHKIAGGAMDAKGGLIYGGLNEHYSGVLNRATLDQEVDAVDIRNMQVRDDLWKLFEKTTGYKYSKLKEMSSGKFSKEEKEKIIEKSVIFCNKVRNMGIKVLYIPDMKG